MPITMNDVRKLNAVRIFSRKDSAIDNEESDWDLYQEDCLKNESVIKFKPNQVPTVFLCNFEFTGKESASVKDAMVQGFDDDKNPKAAYGKWGYLITKYGLKDIQNPPNVKGVIELKKDSRVYVSDETMTKLERLGIVQEIFNHYVVLTSDDIEDNVKN